MVTTYGSFPGVRINVAGGGITAVAIGAEENLVLFGRANYANDGDFTGGDGSTDGLASGLDGSTQTAETINARRDADDLFGADSELAEGLRGALANGANIDFLFGVAPERFNAVDEVIGSQTGTLANAPIWEDDVEDDSNIVNLVVRDSGGTDPTPRLTYDGTPSSPSDADTINVNPLTGEFAADAAPAGSYEFDYKYLDWNSAFTDGQIHQDTVNEDETGIWAPLSDSDAVSVDADNEVTNRRQVFEMINVVHGAEPNNNELIQDSSGNFVRNDARYDTGNYGTANQSVDSDYFFKLAPVREEDEPATVLGEIGGLFSGNPIEDPIYNDELLGIDTSLEQQFTKTDADNMRDNNVIPVRQNGTIRVKDNLSTSTATDWERDFWRRRIADRVILVGKTIGDQILGQINDEDTRNAAERLIATELRSLVNDRLLRPNTATDERWFVEVTQDPNDPDEVNIDIGFTPFGIVKRIDETVTINTG